jgi:ABC-type phosphate/phosphonate transport system substrate-binding protein
MRAFAVLWRQKMPNRRDVLQAAAGLSAALVGLSSKAADPMVFAVNEGVTYRTSTTDFRDRFSAVADDLGKLLKNPVSIQSVGSYVDLQAGLEANRYAVAWVHPAHHAIRAVNRSGYRLLCITKGFQEYKARFLVKAGSPVKTLADLRGKTIGAPDSDSITSVITRATLRDAGLVGDAVKVQYVRYQDAVPFMVEHGLATAGVSASGAVVKDWTDKGGVVIATSKAVPIKHMLASSALTPAQAASVQEYLLGLEKAKDAVSRLAAFKVGGFMPFDGAQLKGLGEWLGV